MEASHGDVQGRIRIGGATDARTLLREFRPATLGRQEIRTFLIAT
jgi:hypothetical protein